MNPSENKHRSIYIENERFLTRELWCGDPKSGIYGRLFLPRDHQYGEKLPLVLFCHELFRTHESGISYGEELAAKGFAVYTFDCRGASKESRSPGSMLNMSVMTCAEDLMEVYREALTWNFTDPGRIAVIGASQGAFSTAVAAGENTDAFAAIVLMYGAFVILDDIKNMYSDRSSVPDPFSYRGWCMMGARYLTDLWDFDKSVLGRYKGPVLILHGDDDPLVDPAYSQDIAKVYENCEFHMVRGGRHGFKKGAFAEAAEYIERFLADYI